MFASSGEDGSIRHFDLRDLEHSTIIYESPQKSPLLRVAWNKKNAFLFATIQQNSNDVKIVDVRYPMKAVKTLKNHEAQVNSIAWAPHNQNHIVTAGDDCQTLIWSLNCNDNAETLHAPDDGQMRGNLDEPYLAYSAQGPVHQLLWCQSRSKWISIAFENKV